MGLMPTEGEDMKSFIVEWMDFIVQIASVKWES